MLDDDARAGTPLAEVLPLAEPVLELEVTPEPGRLLRRLRRRPRGPRDHRRAARRRALGRGRAGRRARARSSDFASVTVEVPELCPRFTARVFTDVEIGPSPLWLQARLAAAGQRPINNVVDITNYVMLLTAQPLHAFDLDKVPGGALIVRTAARGREDDDPRRRRAHASTPRRCSSATANGPTGIAGIMGGQVSEVSDGDDPGPARGRELERDQHPAHLAPARAALGGLARASRSSCTRSSACGRSGSPRG